MDRKLLKEKLRGKPDVTPPAKKAAKPKAHAKPKTPSKPKPAPAPKLPPVIHDEPDEKDDNAPG